MSLFALLLVLLVVAAVAAVAAGLITGGMDDPERTIPVRALPDGRLTARDVVDLRFSPAVRGYRMDQVDAAMERLAAELERLHADADRLRAQVARPEGAPEEGP